MLETDISYDANGNVSQVVEHYANNCTRTYTFTYDVNGNVTQSTISDGTTTKTYNYAYDVNGRLISVTEQ